VWSRRSPSSSTWSKQWYLHELEGTPLYIKHLSWAPSMGRSFHWIAAACEGGRILLFSLRRDVSSTSSLSHIEEEEGDDWEDEEEKPTSSRPPSKGSKKKKKNNRSSNNNTSGGGKEEMVPDFPSYYSLSHIHILRDVGTSEVWKVEWNASGNELFAAIDGHVVLKFNCSFNDQVFYFFYFFYLLLFFIKKGMTWTSSTIEDSSPFYLPNLPNNNNHHSGGVNEYMTSSYTTTNQQQQQTFHHGEESFSIEEKT